MTKAKAILFQNPKVTMTVMSALCLLSIFVYIFSVNLTVRNIVKRQALETELAKVSSHISDLEFQYIQQKNSITLDYALKLGFVPTSDTKYVSRKTSVAMLEIPASDSAFEVR